jgi:hypothetical protein
LEQALLLARLGKHARAVAEAEALAGEKQLSNDDCYYLARAWALCAAAAGDDSRLCARYAARAVKLLRQATEKGYRDLDQMKRDTDLDVLRACRDFQELLTELQSRSAAPKREEGAAGKK